MDWEGIIIKVYSIFALIKLYVLSYRKQFNGYLGYKVEIFISNKQL